jgi:lysophospholipase L1-like esterase
MKCFDRGVPFLVIVALAAIGTMLGARQAAAPADRPAARTDPNSLTAHAQLLEKKTRGRIDVYFAGDSITRRWGATDYPDLLANWKQNFFGWNAANFGWGGDTTQNILWRLHNGELDDVHPEVIVLLAGTNNVGNAPGSGGVDATAENVTRGIRAILDVMRAKAPKATIILTAIFPRNDNMAAMPVIDEINRRIARFADGTTIRFLNINDRLADADGRLFEGMMGDRLHPTITGYQVWAEALKPMLTELLGAPATEDHAPPPTGDALSAGTPSRRSLLAGRAAAQAAPAAIGAPFGKLDDAAVQLYTLTNRHGLVARITNFGAIVTELHVPDRTGKLADIVLGFEDLDSYVKGHPYFGAIVGRVANRIGNAEFTLGGTRYSLDANDRPHHLHGGRKGWDKVVWNARPLDAPAGQALELTYVSKDGEEGYPGTVTAKTVYTLTNDNELIVEMQATTDRTTLVNMAHHSYWNLGGHDSGTILDHELTLLRGSVHSGHADGPRRPDPAGRGHAVRLHPRQSDRQGSERRRRQTDGL